MRIIQKNASQVLSREERIPKQGAKEITTAVSVSPCCSEGLPLALLRGGWSSCGGWCTELLQLPDQEEQADYSTDAGNLKARNSFCHNRLIQRKMVGCGAGGWWQRCGGHQAWKPVTSYGPASGLRSTRMPGPPWAAPGTWPASTRTAGIQAGPPSTGPVPSRAIVKRVQATPPGAQEHPPSPEVIKVSAKFPLKKKKKQLWNWTAMERDIGILTGLQNLLERSETVWGLVSLHPEQGYSKKKKKKEYFLDCLKNISPQKHKTKTPTTADDSRI